MLKQVVIFIGLTLLLSGCSHYSNVKEPLTHNLEKKEGIYSLKKAQSLTMKTLVDEVEHYPVIFVGDHHNTLKTHRFFNQFLQALSKEGYNLHLVNEWFTPEHDELLLMYTNDKLDGIRLKERRHWDKFTRYSWDLVEPLYETVKQSGGKLYGMNLSKKERKKISLKQFDNMSEDEKSFYDSLDVNVSAHNQLVMPFLQHCNKMPQRGNEPCESRMYRVQVAWDSYMANNVVKIANRVIRSSKDKVIVFAGAMHMEQNLGIPLRFSRQSTLPFMTISNEKLHQDSAVKVKVNKADVVYLYE